MEKANQGISYSGGSNAFCRCVFGGGVSLAFLMAARGGGLPAGDASSLAGGSFWHGETHLPFDIGTSNSGWVAAWRSKVFPFALARRCFSLARPLWCWVSARAGAWIRLSRRGPEELAAPKERGGYGDCHSVGQPPKTLKGSRVGKLYRRGFGFAI